MTEILEQHNIKKMRSLTILQERSFTFLGPTKLRIASEQRTSGASEPSTAQPRGLRQFCVDLQDRDVYIAVTESREGHGVPGDKAWSSSDASATFTVIYQLLGDGSFPIRDNSTEWIEVARIPEPDYGGQPRELVSLQFIPDSSSLCLAFSDGDLYLIRHDRGRPARAEDVREPLSDSCSAGSSHVGLSFRWDLLNRLKMSGMSSQESRQWSGARTGKVSFLRLVRLLELFSKCWAKGSSHEQTDHLHDQVKERSSK